MSIKRARTNNGKKSLMYISLALLSLLYIPLVSQELPEFTFTDPVGDVEPPCPSADYIGGWFEQVGDSLLIGFRMAGPFINRDPGWSINEFCIDTNSIFDPSSSYSGSENDIDFHDYGGGNWFGTMYLFFDREKGLYTQKVLIPVIVHEDGKAMTCKFSLVGTNWKDIIYSLDGWYKDGNTWHQVPHWSGDCLDEWLSFNVDQSQVTQLTEKTGEHCIIKVPESYFAIANAKNITGVVDGMVSLVRSKIGTIAESDKIFSVDYENFTDYAHPKYYLRLYSGDYINQFGCRIPGQYWVDEPNWYAMLEGVIDQTLQELSDGLREVFLVQKAYNRPIPGSGEGWYCTDDDSINGLKWDTYHKWTFKALLGNAYENCYVYYIAESMTEGEAKTAIMNKKVEAETAWENFSGTAKDLTPEIMTGLLLSLTDDLSWTERIFKEIVPKSFNLEDEDTTAFEQIVVDYIRHEDLKISSSNDFLTQAHHGWYSSIASVQAAGLELATGEDVYGILQGISGFPLDQEVFNTTIELLTEVAIDNEPEMPVDFKLSQNYPNPYNPLTNISFTIPNRCVVSMKVYNILGEEVATLNDKVLDAGQHRISWNASDLPSGIYFYQLTAADQHSAIRKCVLLK